MCEYEGNKVSDADIYRIKNTRKGKKNIKLKQN